MPGDYDFGAYCVACGAGMLGAEGLYCEDCEIRNRTRADPAKGHTEDEPKPGVKSRFEEPLTLPPASPWRTKDDATVVEDTRAILVLFKYAAVIAAIALAVAGLGWLATRHGVGW